MINHNLLHNLEDNKMQPVNKVKYRETNNQTGGKSGSKVKIVKGPAVGHASGNATKGGGIMQPTKGKK